MSSEEDDDLIEEGEQLPYDKYPKLVLPMKSTKFWFDNRYVVLADDLDGETILTIYGNSDKYGHRNVKLIYKDDGYLVKSAYQETLEEVEELLNELKTEFNKLRGLPLLYQME